MKSVCSCLEMVNCNIAENDIWTKRRKWYYFILPIFSPKNDCLLQNAENVFLSQKEKVNSKNAFLLLQYVQSMIKLLLFNIFNKTYGRTTRFYCLVMKLGGLNSKLSKWSSWLWNFLINLEKPKIFKTKGSTYLVSY